MPRHESAVRTGVTAACLAILAGCDAVAGGVTAGVPAPVPSVAPEAVPSVEAGGVGAPPAAVPAGVVVGSGIVGTTLTNAAPAVPGATADAAFYRANQARFRPGMAWTYETAYEGAGDVRAPDDHTLEVLGVAADRLAMRVSDVGSNAPYEFVVPIDGNPVQWRDPNAGTPDAIQYRVEPPEDITVPAGTYRGAAKISANTGDTTLVAWFVPGVGLIRSEVTTANVNLPDTRVVQQLQRFEPGDGEGGLLTSDSLRRYGLTTRPGHTLRYRQTGTTFGGQGPGDFTHRVEAACEDRIRIRETRNGATSAFQSFTAGPGDQPVATHLSAFADEPTWLDEGPEAVEVPAGRFADARRVRAVGATFNVGLRAWLVPGLGVVKAEAKEVDLHGSVLTGRNPVVELLGHELPAIAAREPVPPPTFPRGGRLLVDGAAVDPLLRWHVADRGQDQPVLTLNATRPLEVLPMRGWSANVVLTGADKTAEGFAVAPGRLAVDHMAVTRGDVPWNGGWATDRDLTVTRLAITGSGDKLTGVIEAEGRERPGDPLTRFKLEFDAFDRTITRR